MNEFETHVDQPVEKKPRRAKADQPVNNAGELSPDALVADTVNNTLSQHGSRDVGSNIVVGPRELRAFENDRTVRLDSNVPGASEEFDGHHDYNKIDVELGLVKKPEQSV